MFRFKFEVQQPMSAWCRAPTSLVVSQGESHECTDSLPLCKRGRACEGAEGDLTVAALATFLNPPYPPFSKGGYSAALT